MKNKKTFHSSGKPAGKTGEKRWKKPDQEPAGDGERIAKRLARAGIASRRDAEAMIAAGRVKVNGRLLDKPAFNVRPSDRIEVDGAPIPEVERTRLFLLYKPAGVVTTSRDPEGRKTVFDILPKGLPRLITVGRLDINTEGLLLLTNDGGLARVLELPSTGWLRRYRVRVHGNVDPLALAELEKGTAVDGVFYGAIEATLDRKQGSNAWLTLGLREGKNREVKNVLGALGLDVTRLIRVSYGPFQLGALPEGAVQEIKGRTLRDQLGERLIEEAGANFDAPIVRPFANKPARAEKPAAAETPRRPAERPRDKEEGRRAPVNRKKSREDKREEMRGRLQTKPPSRAGKDDRKASAGKDDRKAGPGKDGRKADRPVERRSRAANVWMAPGARPVGPKKAEEAAERKGEAKKPGRGTDRKQRPDKRPPTRGKRG
ncbi:pseudouridine synthase [Chelativorans salis]|uniref:pseudouridine synthase n=1 Tax=Chelativorans salis TaxID=2978478 RepID=UPI0028CBA9A6|nr:pseudouridine synthase [Chelativorans sp. EGI FJ00035]